MPAVIVVAVAITALRILGRRAGGSVFTACLIFFFGFLAALMLTIVAERGIGWSRAIPVIRQIAAFALWGESLVDAVLSVLFFSRTRQAQYLGYALLFVAIFSFLSIAMLAGTPVGVIE
jgi:hypothetical protein